MPIYEYVCSTCGKLNETLQRDDDPVPERCDGCGAKGTLRKVVSRSSFVLRGGGWYSDLYSSVKKGAADGKDSKPEKGAGDGKATPEKSKGTEGAASTSKQSSSPSTSPKASKS